MARASSAGFKCRAGVGCRVVESVDYMPARRLESERLTLEPLRSQHAEELAPVLNDVSLHGFTGGEPVGVEDLRARFARQVIGRSPDGRQSWLNWIVLERLADRPIGTVQATVFRHEQSIISELAWVIGKPFQRRGFAKEAVGVMAVWLCSRGVQRLRSHINPDHQASIAVALSIGLQPTDVMLNGEVCWERSCGQQA